MILTFICLISLWCPAYNGAHAYYYVSALNTSSALFYKAPAIFNEIPTEKFSVYVEKWNSQPNVGELPRFYANFFNEKYPKVRSFDTFVNIVRKMSILGDKSQIPGAWVYGDMLLTDNPGLIKQYFLKAEEVKKIPWESGYLSLMNLNLEKNLIGADYISPNDDLNNKNHFFLARWTANDTGTIWKIKIKCGAPGSVKVALYDDSSGSPGSLLNAVNTGTEVVTGWNEISFPYTPVTAGKVYWLASISSSYCIGYKYQADSIQIYKPASFDTFSFPDNAGSGFESSRSYNIMAGVGNGVSADTH